MLGMGCKFQIRNIVTQVPDLSILIYSIHLNVKARRREHNVEGWSIMRYNVWLGSSAMALKHIKGHI